MRYMMFVMGNDDYQAGKPPSPQLMVEIGKLSEEAMKAGKLISSEGLKPAVTRIRLAKGKRHVTDGPFTETKELVAGFWLIQVKSKAEAIEWMKRCPSPSEGQECEIEIRQVFETDDFGPELTPELREQEERVRAMAAKQNKR